MYIKLWEFSLDFRPLKQRPIPAKLLSLPQLAYRILAERTRAFNMSGLP
jgi:hypothetical protein